MIDRIFSVVLTFAVLAGSTLAIGSEFFSTQPVVEVAALPRVVITGSVQRATTVTMGEIQSGTFVR